MSEIKFSLPEFCERYEYVRRSPDQPLISDALGNNAQRKNNMYLPSTIEQLFMIGPKHILKWVSESRFWHRLIMQKEVILMEIT